MTTEWKITFYLSDERLFNILKNAYIRHKELKWYMFVWHNIQSCCYSDNKWDCIIHQSHYSLSRKKNIYLTVYYIERQLQTIQNSTKEDFIYKTKIMAVELFRKTNKEMSVCQVRSIYFVGMSKQWLPFVDLK